MASFTLSKAELVRIAHAAQLELSATELEELSAQLSSILDFFRVLDQESAPTTDEHAAALGACPLRSDEPAHEARPGRRILDHAPAAEEGCFRVPLFIEDD